ncbi:Hypothetical protein PBC10988_19350 [Planctomycetales bacterium 10988]|nr:Hypothetical protein PBC10988_19350 [Planctomycetales bacterium 10988]
MWLSDFIHSKSSQPQSRQQVRDTPLNLEQLEQRQLLAGDPILIDIDPTGSSYPIDFTEVNGTAYFTALTPSEGDELWKTDGTTAGTELVADIVPGSEGSYIDDLINVNGTLFFTANTASYGRELWKTDGTSAGTVLVKDITPGTDDTLIQDQLAVNGTLYFRFTDGTYGRELWKSDGTSAGTTLVKDLNPGTADSNPAQFTNFNGTLFFNANDGSTGSELWKTDGTSAGTEMVIDFNGSSGGSPAELTNVNGTLFFEANDGTYGRELWKSDGTSAGTELVKDLNPSGNGEPDVLTNVGGTLFFSARDGEGGDKLWKSDGTSAGTELLLDADPESAFDTTTQLLNVNGTLFFVVRDGPSDSYELWKSDGTSAGTVLIKDLNEGGYSYYAGEDIVPINGTVYFSLGSSTYGYELWRSDGTSAGTVLVEDIAEGTKSSYPQDLANINGTLYFTADYASPGYYDYELFLIKPEEEKPLIVTGSDSGSGVVRVFDETGTEQYNFFPFTEAFTGSVRVATGDINGDGVLDIVTAAGPGGGPRVSVYDSETGLLITEGLSDFYAYDPTFIGGVFVAVGDVNDDGFDDIITGADAGGGPHVKVFSGEDGTVITEFYAYDPSFLGGVRLAAGDVDGDMMADIITGPGTGGGPHVRVFSGTTGEQLEGAATDFYAYDAAFTGGIFVASGDINDDGFDDIITGAGASGGPHVKVFSSDDASVIHEFYAYDPSFTGGVRVASFDLNDDGFADILTVPGPTGGPHTRAFSGVDLSDLANFYSGSSTNFDGLFIAGGISVVPIESDPEEMSSFFASEDSAPPEDLNLDAPSAKKSWANDTEEFFQSAEEIDKLFSGLGIQ